VVFQPTGLFRHRGTLIRPDETISPSAIEVDAMWESFRLNRTTLSYVTRAEILPAGVLFIILLLFYLLVTGISTGEAQQPKAHQQHPSQKTLQPEQPAQPIQLRAAIQSQADLELVTILVRATLIAVHQANVTGNYTVLRDLAAPAFQEKNSAADLSLIFASVRQQKIDLSAAAWLEPKFTQPPVINALNMVRMIGTLATKPVPVAFDLTFQLVGATWRLIVITIGPLSAGAPVTANEPARSAEPVPALVAPKAP
jgi:hypothetical protein